MKPLYSSSSSPNGINREFIRLLERMGCDRNIRDIFDQYAPSADYGMAPDSDSENTDESLPTHSVVLKRSQYLNCIRQHSLQVALAVSQGKLPWRQTPQVFPRSLSDLEMIQNIEWARALEKAHKKW